MSEMRLTARGGTRSSRVSGADPPRLLRELRKRHCPLHSLQDMLTAPLNPGRTFPPQHVLLAACPVGAAGIADHGEVTAPWKPHAHARTKRQRERERERERESERERERERHTHTHTHPTFYTQREFKPSAFLLHTCCGTNKGIDLGFCLCQQSFIRN